MWEPLRELSAPWMESDVDGEVDRLIQHLMTFYPDRCLARGPGDLEALVRLAAGRARGYGMTSEVAIRLFLDLGFALGERFDAELAWARVILTSSALDDEGKRRSLYEKARSHLLDAGDGVQPALCE